MSSSAKYSTKVTILDKDGKIDTELEIVSKNPVFVPNKNDQNQMIAMINEEQEIRSMGLKMTPDTVLKGLYVTVQKPVFIPSLENRVEKLKLSIGTLVDVIQKLLPLCSIPNAVKDGLVQMVNLFKSIDSSGENIEGNEKELKEALSKIGMI